MGFRKAAVLLFGTWLSTACLIAQEPAVDPAGTQVATEQSPASAENADALRKAAQNPIASLISVPVQNNSNFGVGSDDRIQDVLNIQPVIPVPLSKKLNMIARIITPIVYQPTTNQPTDQGAYGFGDLNPTFFFAPSKASRLIWGVGPAFVLPTATNSYLGQGKWSIGPSVVALAQPGKWTLGALVNNVFSVGGQEEIRSPQVENPLGIRHDRSDHVGSLRWIGRGDDATEPVRDTVSCIARMPIGRGLLRANLVATSALS